MPRGYGLSEVTKGAIWELRAQGLSDREIGRRLCLPRKGRHGRPAWTIGVGTSFVRGSSIAG
jgi:hypothetical protein